MSVRRMVFWMALLFGAATTWADVTLTGVDAEVVVAADDSPVVRFAATEMTSHTTARSRSCRGRGVRGSDTTITTSGRTTAWSST